MTMVSDPLGRIRNAIDATQEIKDNEDVPQEWRIDQALEHLREVRYFVETQEDDDPD